jgi:hypothetical protein
MVGGDIVTHDVAHRRSGLRAAEDEQEPEIGAVVSVEGGCGLNKSYTMSDGEDDEGEGEPVAAAGGAEPEDADAAAAAAAAAAPAGLVFLIGVLCTAIIHCNAKLESCLNASAKCSPTDP